MVKPIDTVVPKSKDCVTLLQLSDLHFQASTFGTDGQRAPYVNHLDAALRRCLQDKHKVDLLVVTGDIIDQSEHFGDCNLVFERARKYIDYVAANILEIKPEDAILAVPGNHDYRWRGNIFLKRGAAGFESHFKPYFRHVLYPQLRLLVACFDSNATRYRYELAKGNIDVQTINEFEKALNELPKESAKIAQSEATRIALVHHHPLPIAEAEVLAPQSWFDYVLGRRVEGAPEYMMLRNAGTYLHRMLNAQFRLILHGHLHKPGYWRPTKFIEGQERWLEVIGCGSSGRPPGAEASSFNVIKIFPSGYLQCARYSYGGEGLTHDPVLTPSAPYELIRSSNWARGPKESNSVRCDRLEKRWEVYLPSGDIVSTEVYVGLRAENGFQQEFVPVSTISESLTESTATARCLSPGHSVEAVRSKEGNVVTWNLKFTPALTHHPVNVKFQRRMSGIMFASSESQRRFGMEPGAIGVDSCTQRVETKVEQLSVCLQFLPDDDGLELDAFNVSTPKDVQLFVEDQNRNILRQEQNSQHVIMTYWPNHREADTDEFHGNQFPQALLTVYRPQVGHRYKLRWNLPDHEVLQGREVLLHQWRRLHELRLTTGEPDILKKYVDRLLTTVKDEFAKEFHTSNWSDPNLQTFLYAFNESKSILECVCSSSTAGQPLPARIRWGRQIVGTAFRRAQIVIFSKPEFEKGSELFDEIPEDVAVIFAIPVMTMPIPVEHFPQGILAFASTDPSSGLCSTLKNDNIINRLHQIAVEIWDATVQPTLQSELWATNLHEK